MRPYPYEFNDLTRELERYALYSSRRVQHVLNNIYSSVQKQPGQVIRSYVNQIALLDAGLVLQYEHRFTLNRCSPCTGTFADAPRGGFGDVARL